MLKRPRTDFWTVGLVPLPIAQVTPEALRACRDAVVWLPEAGPWRYYADPFALRRGDLLHVFVEAFDYRTKHGRLERLDYDLARRAWGPARTVLELPVHLSYPFVFDHGGETFMVPETCGAREIALYRAAGSLDRWERVQALLADVPGADASLLQHGGGWWMFYAIVGPKARDRRELHVAHAPALTGPWRPVAANPVHVDLGGARPGGTPFVGADGVVCLPVQDSQRTYGGAVRVLRFPELSPERVRVEDGGVRLTGDMVSSVHVQGLHTLSACGEFSLVDVKRIDRSRVKQWLDLKRRARRLARRLAPAGRA